MNELIKIKSAVDGSVAVKYRIRQDGSVILQPSRVDGSAIPQFTVYGTLNS